MSFVLLPGAALRGPLHPDADTAREWLRQELLRREYRPNLVQRMQEWFQELLEKAQGGAGSLGGLGDAVLLGLTVVVALLLVLVLSRLRRNAGADRTPEPVFGDVRRSAAEHEQLLQAARLVRADAKEASRLARGPPSLQLALENSLDH